MKFLRDMSIKTKLMIVAVAASGIAFLIAAPAFIFYDQYSFERSTVENMEALADIVGTNCSAAMMFSDHEDAVEVLAALEADSYIEAAFVFDNSGDLFAEYKRRKIDRNLPSPWTMAELEEKSEETINLVRNIVFNGEYLGSISLRVGRDKLHLRTHDFRQAAGVIVVCSFLLVILMVSRLQRIVSQPILDLAETARAVSEEGDYDLRALETGKDEVGFLVEKFNEMLDQIQKRDGQLVSAKDVLEERVRQRTTDLVLEVEQRRDAEERIRSSLEEKEILLKEIHHRVKNNLQVISSLLSLQCRKIEDVDVLEMFKDSERRVRSMALIHEKLYRSGDLARIDFADYATNLIGVLVRTFDDGTRRVSVETDFETIHLGVDQAVPCGLILNELISNAFKHAFSGRRVGVVSAAARLIGAGTAEVTIADDGVGLADDFDPSKLDSLGMQLVFTLAQQLSGKIEAVKSNGTMWKLNFPTDPVSLKGHVEHAEANTCS